MDGGRIAVLWALAILFGMLLFGIVWTSRRYDKRVLAGLFSIIAAVLLAGSVVWIEWACVLAASSPTAMVDGIRHDNDGTVRLLMLLAGAVFPFILTGISGMGVGWLVPAHARSATAIR